MSKAMGRKVDGRCWRVEGGAGMKSGISNPRRGTRRYAVPALAVLLAVSASPLAAEEETVLERSDLVWVVDSAVVYHYQKTIERNHAEAACYFDAKIEKTMRCSWTWSDGGGDSFQFKNKVRRQATKWCKQAGGRKCVLFWRNGRIRFDALSPEQVEKADSVLGKIRDHDVQARPLPEGVGVSQGFLNWFSAAREHLENDRRKYRGRNPHYAICANENGPATWFSMWGSVDMAEVRNMCTLKCVALSELLSKEGECYVVFEDGKFASAAAEAAVTQ